MGTFQSAFHPIFWMHHCNIDRLYQKYLELEPDSKEEMQRHERLMIKRGTSKRPVRGLPDGTDYGTLVYITPKLHK